MSNLLQHRPQAAPYCIDTFRPHLGYPYAGQSDDEVGKNEATDRQSQILLIGDEPSLQYSRRMILEAAGYKVRTAKSNVVVEELFLRGIEVVLLCHTIRRDVEESIVNTFARLRPHIALLRISPLDEPLGDPGRPGVVSARPTALLGAVAAMLPHP